MERLAIRCTPCAPVDTAEVEQWLEETVDRLRASGPHTILRLLHLTQTAPTRDIGIGWLLEIDSACCGDEPFDEDLLDALVRDARLLGLQPTVLRATSTNGSPPLAPAEARLNGAGI
jgi:hypothetical protein